MARNTSACPPLSSVPTTRYLPIRAGRGVGGAAPGVTVGSPDKNDTDRSAFRSLRKISSRRRQTEQPCRCDWIDSSALSPANRGISSSSLGQVALIIAEVLHVRLALFANASHDAGGVHIHGIGWQP